MDESSDRKARKKELKRLLLKSKTFEINGIHLQPLIFLISSLSFSSRPPGETTRSGSQDILRKCANAHQNAIHHSRGIITIIAMTLSWAFIHSFILLDRLIDSRGGHAHTHTQKQPFKFTEGNKNSYSARKRLGEAHLTDD